MVKLHYLSEVDLKFQCQKMSLALEILIAKLCHYTRFNDILHNCIQITITRTLFF